MSLPLHTSRRASAQTNLDLATDLVTSCFDPVRPDEFARFCADERGRFVFAAFAGAFPDARFRVDWTVADDHRVVLGGRTQATHQGTWRSIEPTGRPIDVATVTTLGLASGRVITVAVVTDSLSLAEQIGAVEPFAPPACRLFQQAPPA